MSGVSEITDMQNHHWGSIQQGSAGIFLDRTTAQHLHIPLIELPSPVELNTINGGPIWTGYVTHRTPPLLTCVCCCLHQKHITFLITDTYKHLLILSNPWLHKHDPVISWSSREIIRWSVYCQCNWVIALSTHTSWDSHLIGPMTVPLTCRWWRSTFCSSVIVVTPNI